MSEETFKDFWDALNDRNQRIINEAKKKQKEACAAMSEDAKDIYDAFIGAGFTEKQAFELLKTILGRSQ